MEHKILKGKSLPTLPIHDDNTKYTYFILGLIIVTGFLLRIYKLSYQSIWLDEAFSIYHSQQNFMHSIILKDPSPALYYVLLHCWITRGDYNGETQEVLNYISDNYVETDPKEYLLNHNPALINNLYKYFEEKRLIHLQFNRIKISHFQKSRRGFK